MSNDENIIKILDSFPKYIGYDKHPYTFIIQKNDWDGNSNAWIAMYAKENISSISTVKTLIRVEGDSFLDIIQKMKESLSKFKEENKGNPKIYRL